MLLKNTNEVAAALLPCTPNNGGLCIVTNFKQ